LNFLAQFDDLIFEKSHPAMEHRIFIQKTGFFILFIDYQIITKNINAEFSSLFPRSAAARMRSRIKRQNKREQE